MNRLNSFLILRHTKYKFLWEKHGFSKSNSQMDIDWLKTIIYRHRESQTNKKIKCFYLIGDSDGSIGIREYRMISSLNFPLKIVALKTCPVMFLMIKHYILLICVKYQPPYIFFSFLLIFKSSKSFVSFN